VEGSTAGGTKVTVSGTGFGPGMGATRFKFGSTVATQVECLSATKCIVIAPSHKARTVQIRATVSGMTSPKEPSADDFTYR
jgi:IPT/TIG domain